MPGCTRGTSRSPAATWRIQRPARQEFRKTPTYWRAVFALANLEDPATTLEKYEEALTLGPPPAVERQLRFSLGQVALGVGDNKRARYYFTSILSDHIDDYRSKAAHQYLTIIDAGGLEAYQHANSNK